MIRQTLLFCVLLFSATSAHAVIVFRKGWDNPENSDVRSFTEEDAKNFLRNKSDELRIVIDGPSACVIEVVKGCHQRGDKAHFTINGEKSKKCKKTSQYVGSRNVHIPCR